MPEFETLMDREAFLSGWKFAQEVVGYGEETAEMVLNDAHLMIGDPWDMGLAAGLMEAFGIK